MLTRREFGRMAAAVAATGMTAKSYARVVGANNRVQFATFGLNSRAYAHLSALKANQQKAALAYVADVDTVILRKFVAAAGTEMGVAPEGEQDFRRVLDRKDVDAVSIATPDHWHTPMAILAMQAGKHVYVEKPCSHDPHECQLIVEAQKKTGRVVQMGNQQRSSPHTQEVVQKIASGVIGRAYYGKCWYSNARKSMGTGKVVPVPTTLNWDLWQGPAPREAYKDNIHPYNWHWLRRYGTGEALNNGTHEFDVCRWALGLDGPVYPKQITAAGGRYAFKDDWQFYDTLNASFEYDDKLIEWENMSSNDMPLYGRERGAAIHGETGTVVVDRDGYDVFDLKGKQTGTYRIPKTGKTTSADTVGRDSMTDAHFGNFIDAVRTGEALRSPIANASVSVAILLMANIAWETQRALSLNPQTGAFVGDAEATKMRTRTYEPGWEPKV